MTLSGEAGSIWPANVLSYISYSKQPQSAYNCFRLYILIFSLPSKARLPPNDVYFWCNYHLFKDVQCWHFSSHNTPKFQILSYERDIYLKRKLRACAIRIQQEKMRISAKNKIKLIFFNFLHMLENPKKYRCSIFQKNFKRNFINGSSGTSQILTETK